jgi:hypothetical protein
LRSKRKVFTWKVSNCPTSPMRKSTLALSPTGYSSASPRWLSSK